MTKEIETLKQNKNNHIKFTKEAIDALPVPSKETRFVTYYDTECKDLCLIVTYGGTKTFYFYKKTAGFGVIRLKIEVFNKNTTNLPNIRSKVDNHRASVNNGDNPAEDRKKLLNDMNLWDFYTKIYKPRHSNVYKKENSIKKDDVLMRNYIVKYFGKKKMVTITKSDIENLHKSMVQETTLFSDKPKKFSVCSANRVLELIRHMYNKAIEWGKKFSKGNPAAQIRCFPEKPRTRFMNAEELKRFFEHLEKEQDTSFRDYLYLLLFIAQRKSNIISLKWSDVDLENGLVFFADTKNNEPHYTTLTPSAMKVLESMKKIATSEFLFPNQAGTNHRYSFEKAWNRFRRETGLLDLHEHDLRRTMGSYEAITGASLQIIGKSLGHKDYESTLVYAHLTQEPVREAMTVAENKMLNGGTIAVNH